MDEVVGFLRLAFEVARMLREFGSSELVQAWFTGLNPDLGDQAPIRLIRNGDLGAVAPEILRAARTEAEGGD